jgi:hypothetical protein
MITVVTGRGSLAVRDLTKYVDWEQRRADPWEIIEHRKKDLAKRL